MQHHLYLLDGIFKTDQLSRMYVPVSTCHILIYFGSIPLAWKRLDSELG